MIFYEPVPSAIRTVQRRGRTGRQEKGRVIVLITRKTRDEGNLWASVHKEKRMYRVIHSLKQGFKPDLEQPAEAIETSEKQTRLGGKEAETFAADLSIFADYREKGSGIIKDLSDKGVKVELSKLDVGDYLLSERVVVEHKTVKDFADSIIDGRLLSQLANLKKYERPFVVIEGEEDIYSQRKIHPNAIRGVLSTIIISYGIPVVFTRNFKEDY